jgi:hypothetical protein
MTTPLLHASLRTQTALRPEPNEARDRLVGGILVATSLLSVLLMAHHPTIRAPGQSAAAIVAEMAEKAATSKRVHGGLLALLAAQSFAFLELSLRVGLARRAVRAALLAYGIAWFAMTCAALISGFVLPNLALNYANAPGVDAEALRYSLSACAAGNRALASYSAVSASVAIGLISLVLGSQHRALAALGLLVSAGPAFAILLGVLHLEVSGMTLVVASQTLWYVAIGVALWRGTLLPSEQAKISERA